MGLGQGLTAHQDHGDCRERAVAAQAGRSMHTRLSTTRAAAPMHCSTTSLHGALQNALHTAESALSCTRRRASTRVFPSIQLPLPSSSRPLEPSLVLHAGPVSPNRREAKRHAHAVRPKADSPFLSANRKQAGCRMNSVPLSANTRRLRK